MAYCLLFSFSLLLSWVLRDFAKPLLAKLPWIIKEDEHSDAWFGQQAVYRVSMGNFLLFAILSAVMIGVRYKSDKRDRHLHHGGWLVKVVLWLFFNVVPFFFPIGLVNAYSWFARFASPLFLGVQMLILLDMTQNWNDAWVDKGDEDERYLYGLLAITGVCYAFCTTIAGLLYYWFAPSSHDCSFNITIITVAVILCLSLSLMSLHPAVEKGSLFPSACISLYVMYLCYSSMASEPRDYECNKYGQRLNAATGTTLAAGMGLTLLSVVYSAFRAGSNTSTFTGGSWQEEAARPLMEAGDEEDTMTSAGLDGLPPDDQNMRRREEGGSTSGKAMEEFDPVTYSYAQFYLVFALASMYIAMLMTGWGSSQQAPDLIDVGWTSVWVKVVTQWCVAALYMWTMAAPLLFPDREF